MKLTHNVFFTLNDGSPAAVEKLVTAARKLISQTPNLVYGSAGARGPEYARPVNDQDFHVTMNVVFQDKAAHDAYQTFEPHQTFINENKANWKTVRVFDAYVN